MAESRKYYYLKIKETFFNDEQMIVLESLPDGCMYSNILLKLYLCSLKNEGCLMFNNRIPYSPTVLASIVRHPVGVVEKALKIFQEFGLIEILDNGAIFVLDIQNYIGESSTEADRQRAYQKRIAAVKKQPLIEECKESCKKSNSKSTPELELEIELEIELETELETEREQERERKKAPASEKSKQEDKSKANGHNPGPEKLSEIGNAANRLWFDELNLGAGRTYSPIIGAAKLSSLTEHYGDEEILDAIRKIARIPSLRSWLGGKGPAILAEMSRGQKIIDHVVDQKEAEEADPIELPERTPEQQRIWDEARAKVIKLQRRRGVYEG